MRTNYEIRELVLADEDVLFGTTAIEISALDFYGDVLARGARRQRVQLRRRTRS